jgi:hypothetical protein
MLMLETKSVAVPVFVNVTVWEEALELTAT